MSQISLTFPDGNSRDYPAGITAAQVAESIAPSLAKRAISASLDGRHIDLQWPINDSGAMHTRRSRSAPPPASRQASQSAALVAQGQDPVSRPFVRADAECACPVF